MHAVGNPFTIKPLVDILKSQPTLGYTLLNAGSAHFVEIYGSLVLEVIPCLFFVLFLKSGCTRVQCGKDSEEAFSRR